MTSYDQAAADEYRAFVESLPRPPAPPCPDWCDGGHGVNALNVDRDGAGLPTGAGVTHTTSAYSGDGWAVEVIQSVYVDADGQIGDDGGEDEQVHIFTPASRTRT